MIGRVHRIRLPNPSIGTAVRSFIIPESIAKARVLSVSGTLSTDATVANRYPNLKHRSQNSDVIARTATAIAQGAGDSRTWTWQGGMSGEIESGDGAQVFVGIGCMTLLGGDHLAIYGTEGADDVFTDCVLTIEEVP